MSEEWITLEKTAERLNRSPRTLEKWIRDGRLKGRMTQTKGGRRERVFEAGHIEEVARMLEAEAGQVQLQRVARPAAHESVAEPSVVRELLAMVRELQDRLLEGELRRKDWLTPRECYSGWGLPARLVVELAEAGRLAGVRYGKGWRIQRKSLEAFAG